MPIPGHALQSARSAAARVEELDAIAADRESWVREIERLDAEIEAAHPRAAAAADDHEHALTEARASKGLMGAVRDRLAGGLPQGRTDRRARVEAAEAEARGRREAEESRVRRLEAEREEARRHLFSAEGAIGQRDAARRAERKAFLALAGAGPTDIERAAAELQKLERRCDAWRSARKAAIARRDHTKVGLEQLHAFERSWPELKSRLGDVIHGDAGPPPAEAIDHLRRARHELYLGARAGVPGFTQGVLADIASIAAHEIDKPAAVRMIAAVLTRAISELTPIADAAATTLSTLENNLATTDEACEALRKRIHRIVLERQ